LTTTETEPQDLSPFSVVIDEVRQKGENWTQGLNNDDSIVILGSWLGREAHLALRRAHDMMADGIPADTAFFLAVDDMGFQLAHAYVQAVG
jgi:hypothetical protein